jgi:hypothetical protein
LRYEALGDGYSLLACALYIEGDPALPLDPLHPVIEQPRAQHVTKAYLQFLGFDMRVPRTAGRAIIVEHTNHAKGQVLDVPHPGIRVRSGCCADFRNVQIAEIGFVARSRRRMRDMQSRFAGQNSSSARSAFCAA